MTRNEGSMPFSRGRSMSKRLRIGLVDLDTSHPHAFTAILRTLPGVDVVALWDGHDVWPAGYDRKFAAEHNIPKVCETLEEMLPHVDAAMIHGTDWDKHIDKAIGFMREGIPVLIDKPVVGSVRDCDRLLNLQARFGSIVYGGSSLRFAEEITGLKKSLGSREGLVSALASGPGDFFSYGIHTTEMLQGCIGTGAKSVTATSTKRSPILTIQHEDEVVGMVQLQLPHHEWSLAVYTSEGTRFVTVGGERLYEPFLRHFIGLLRGEQVDYSLEGPIEAVRLHIAARLSIASGKSIVLSNLPSDAGFDGAAFAAAYAAEKKKQRQAE
jgi:Oxidoreductase family, NAD-binding Rossmann fold